MSEFPVVSNSPVLEPAVLETKTKCQESRNRDRAQLCFRPGRSSTGYVLIEVLPYQTCLFETNMHPGLDSLVLFTLGSISDIGGIDVCLARPNCRPVNAGGVRRAHALEPNAAARDNGCRHTEVLFRSVSLRPLRFRFLSAPFPAVPLPKFVFLRPLLFRSIPFRSVPCR